MIASLATPNPQRYKVLDFSRPLVVSENMIGWYRPKLQPDLLGFVKPFTVNVSILQMILG